MRSFIDWFFLVQSIENPDHDLWWVMSNKKNMNFILFTDRNTYNQPILKNNSYERWEKLIDYLPDSCPMVIKMIHIFKSTIDTIVIRRSVPTTWNKLLDWLAYSKKTRKRNVKLTISPFIYFPLSLTRLIVCPCFINFKMHDLDENISKSHKEMYKEIQDKNMVIS